MTQHNQPPKPAPEPYESTLEQRLREMYWRMKNDADMEASE